MIYVKRITRNETLKNELVNNMSDEEVSRLYNTIKPWRSGKPRFIVRTYLEGLIEAGLIPRQPLEKPKPDNFKDLEFHIVKIQ